MSPLPTVSSVLCLFQGESSELNALDAAFGLARRFGAVLRVLHISTPPMNIIDSFGASAYAGAFVSEAAIDRIVKDDDDLIAAARHHVSVYAARQAVPVCLDEHQLALAAAPAVLFITQENYPGQLIDVYGRMADIIVAARVDSQGLTDESRVLPALLDTGRAVILVPPGLKALVRNAFSARCVAIAWDGSLQASHALNNALPLLRDVKNLYLLSVREHGHTPPPTKAILLLREYGIEPVVKELNTIEQSIGETLLASAADLKADLLVMGAYGNNRIAEMLLGGASRYVLKFAPIPVLMTH